MTAAAHQRGQSPWAHLIASFEAQHRRMIRAVLDRVDVSAAGDEMARDFFLNRLPPLPKGTGGKEELQVSGEAANRRQWDEWMEAEAEEKYDAGQPLPILPHTLVRLRQPDFLHCSLHTGQRPLRDDDAEEGEERRHNEGQPEEQGEEKGTRQRGGKAEVKEEGTTERKGREHQRQERKGHSVKVEDGGEGDRGEVGSEVWRGDLRQWVERSERLGGWVQLSHALHNDPLTHMDSTHPPPPSSSIQLSPSWAMPMLRLLHQSPDWLEVRELGDDGVDLCAELWPHRLIEMRPNAGRTAREGGRHGNCGCRTTGDAEGAGKEGGQGREPSGAAAAQVTAVPTHPLDSALLTSSAALYSH